MLRLQFPDGYQIPVHWHPTGENVTVVSGSLALGMGNTFDASALHTYGAGDFAYLPPAQSHYGQAHGATIVQINGRGPFVINPGAERTGGQSMFTRAATIGGPSPLSHS